MILSILEHASILSTHAGAVLVAAGAPAHPLAEENRDFMDFVNLVRQFHLIGEVKNEDWDARPDEA